MIRAFLALELPAEVLRRLADVAGELDALGLAGRRTRLEAIHLTLQFLGNIELALIEEIRPRLNPLAESVRPFELRVAGLGAFPHLGNPRIVWAGVRVSDALERLQTGVEAELEQLGFRREGRPFRPHLTLFRLKSPRNRDKLVRYLNRRPAPPEFGAFEVRDFHLFQSVLKPTGAEYDKLVTWPLGLPG